MRDEPSRTARATAAYRAAHQLMNNGCVFEDSYAVAITGMSKEEIITRAQQRAGSVADVVVRSRYTEDRIAEAVKNGLRQVAIMGAGLDTFGLRNPHTAQGLKVFEVDHPLTQNFKQDRMAAEGWVVDAERHILVPVDFERESWNKRLQELGCDLSQPVFFTWLGVMTYLSKSTSYECIEMMAAVPGAEAVIEYGYAPDHYPVDKRTGLLNEMKICESIGEPWIGLFATDELQSAIRRSGFDIIEDCGPYQALKRYDASFYRPPPEGSPGACLLHAKRAGS